MYRAKKIDYNKITKTNYHINQVSLHISYNGFGTIGRKKSKVVPTSDDLILSTFLKSEFSPF